MRFDPAPRRAVSENLLPMINVVFLLLIFFLIAAKLAPPEPFELTPPEAAGAPVAELPEGVLYLAPGGLVGWGEARGEAAWDALATTRAGCATDCDAALVVRADAGLAGADLAAAMARLRQIGVDRISLVSRAR
ncbi:ExbD/TolR family protein [Pseudothioclava nitratireducens]|uniref:ExbD/TolR family protein n=1 Tax=Pseudothioclava nitratireducens TaxID=1928646 RepID=UPI0023D9DAEA|nr:biopolymer transporter ExbD [Defluviimonas nitratireducens]MDF1619465.1 biopolymer transporter ExbD [Defluviimonas nitratireducens]